MDKNRAFSLYDIEQFLKDAGAERFTEKAVISLERELQDTVSGLISEAAFYANYAGRRKLISTSDIDLASGSMAKRRVLHNRKRRAIRARAGPKRSSAMKEAPSIIEVQGTSVRTRARQTRYI